MSTLKLIKRLALLSTHNARLTAILESDDDAEDMDKLAAILQDINKASGEALSCIGPQLHAHIHTHAHSNNAVTIRGRETGISPAPRAAAAAAAADPLSALSNAFRNVAEDTPAQNQNPLDQRIVNKADIIVYFEDTDENIVLDPGVHPGMVSEVMLKDFVLQSCKDIPNKAVYAKLVDCEDHEYVMMEVPL